MKVVILAGGYGTRISEESHLKPKPMIEIGEKPILWHIMKEYSYYGLNDFVICCGYMQHVIKQWFANYYLYNCDVTFDFTDNNKIIIHNSEVENWKVTLVDTGLNTMTGGRIKRIQKYVDGTFMMTYGDGVANVNLRKLLEFHKKNHSVVTLTAAKIQQRFGVLTIDPNSKITSFREKSDNDSERVNAGYMVMEPEIFDYIEGDSTFLEKEPLENLAKAGKLLAYKFDGFWHPMDTLRDKKYLEELWNSGQAPWNVWSRKGNEK